MSVNGLSISQHGLEQQTNGLWVHRGKMSVGQPAVGVPGGPGDLNVNRGGGQGVIYFGSSGSSYIHYTNTSNGWSFVPPLGTTALAANVVHQPVVTYWAGVSWSTPSAGAWHETPIQATGTVPADSGPLRVEYTVPILNTVAGSINYIGLGLNGSLSVAVAACHEPAANYVQTLSGTYYWQGMGAGSYRFAIFMHATSGVGTIWNGVGTSLYVTAQKR